MKTLLATSALSALALSAGCATTSSMPARDIGTVTGAHLSLDTRSNDDAVATFPARLSPAALPGADRLANRIAIEGGRQVTAAVKLCVAPDGKVDKVDLLTSSGVDDYDRAVVDGMTSWRYAAYAAPTSLHVCERVDVSYHVE